MDLGLEPPIKKIRIDGGSAPASVSGMETLPREIALDILSRLPATSLSQFRHVCRSWRSLTRDPLLPEMQLTRTAMHNPFLVFHCDSPIRNQLSFIELSAAAGDSNSASSAAAVRKFHPPFKMEEFEVVGSCNGLLCLFDSLYKESHCLYNPFTGENLLLPEPKQFPNQESVFGFGLDRRSSTYKVLKVVYYTNSASSARVWRRSYSLSDAQILTIGDSKWRSLGKVPYQIGRRPADALLLHGRLHWVTRQRRYRPSLLVSFDLSDEEFREVPKPENGALSWRNYQLTDIGGRLAATVYCNYGKVEIWVMKVYGERDTWQKEYSIGTHVPKGLTQNRNLPLKMCRNLSRRVRALCLLEKTGEILLEYKGRALVAYDPKKGKFRDILLKGTPNWFQSYLHLGTLSWLDSHNASW